MVEQSIGDSTVSHYVDNERFQKLLVQRKVEYEKNGKPPRVSEELGMILLKISQNLSFRRNFINYSYRDEMVGDGVENCLKYIDNYDSEKYSNPFAYFTQICFYAFVRRLSKEDKQVTIKGAVYESQSIEHQLEDRWEFQNSVVDDYTRSS